jgi:hypothetical protein
VLFSQLEGFQPEGAVQQINRSGASARLLVVERAADLPAWVATAPMPTSP